MRSSVKGRGRHGYGPSGDDENATARILNVSCGTPVKATDLEDASCPRQCPYLAERVAIGEGSCYFKCVKSTQCGKDDTDHKARVPDSNMGTCRRCWVPGCADCAPIGADVCARCSDGYSLKDGRCVSDGRITWTVVMVVSLLLVSFVLV